jgi:enterochelin esterase-like enzyme
MHWFWDQQTVPLRDLAVGVGALLATSGFFNFGHAAELPGPGESQTGLTKVEQALAKAGASAADIAWMENQLRDAPAEDIAGYVDYLGKQSPDELDKTVKDIESDSQYSLGPDSQPHAGVPEGNIQEFGPTESRIFPGFEHEWWLYIPAQYTDQKPIPVMIFLDGEWWVKRNGHWRAPVVLDNLIARKELPVMAAVFVSPGASIGKSKGKAFLSNRQEEYDTLSGAYASFLLEEIFPQVRKHVHIAKDAAGRGIAGCSSGGIASFTVAWQRPDQFRKVISFSGSFADLRGGQIYPELVRQGKRKPIRVFQHVGTNDMVLEGLPSWLDENRLMSAALDETHYDHKYVVDHGTHCSVGAASILPDAMRWAWRDYSR